MQLLAKLDKNNELRNIKASFFYFIKIIKRNIDVVNDFKNTTALLTLENNID
jgi:hypothetical protein